MAAKRGTRSATEEQSKSEHNSLKRVLYVPQETSTEVQELPLLPIRNTVLMPNVVTPLFVGRDQSMRAIEDAMSKDRTLFVVTQLNEETEDPGPDDMYAVGIEGSIDRLLKMPDGTTSILIRGQRRLRLLEYTQHTPYMRARVETVHEVAERTLALEALVRAVLALFEKCVKLSRALPEEAYITAMNIDEPGWLADFILSSLEPSIPERQDILEAFDIEERLQKISILLSKELNILELENHIHNQVQQEVDKTQREYFLREQLKAIQRELGETDPEDGPSAGITMATALISALTKRAARRDVAMTGEITLRGRVLPIGGVKEKVLAAHRAGIKTFILPKRNMKDLEDVPGEVIQELHIVPVERMDDVVNVALHAIPPALH